MKICIQLPQEQICIECGKRRAGHDAFLFGDGYAVFERTGLCQKPVQKSVKRRILRRDRRKIIEQQSDRHRVEIIADIDLIGIHPLRVETVQTADRVLCRPPRPEGIQLRAEQPVIFPQEQMRQQLQNGILILRIGIDNALFLRAELADDRTARQRERLSLLHIGADACPACAVDPCAELLLCLP